MNTEYKIIVFWNFKHMPLKIFTSDCFYCRFVALSGTYTTNPLGLCSFIIKRECVFTFPFAYESFGTTNAVMVKRNCTMFIWTIDVCVLLSEPSPDYNLDHYDCEGNSNVKWKNETLSLNWVTKLPGCMFKSWQTFGNILKWLKHSNDVWICQRQRSDQYHNVSEMFYFYLWKTSKQIDTLYTGTFKHQR